MQVLIVESDLALGGMWQRHLNRLGFEVKLVGGQVDAIDALIEGDISIIIMDVVLNDGCAFAVSDFASYRCPDVKVIFVTSSSFFSDGSIFQYATNACAFLQARTSPDDLAVMVEHYGAPSLVSP